MLEKKRPVRLLPLMAGMLDGANHPISPNPITFRSVRSQSLSKLSFNPINISSSAFSHNSRPHNLDLTQFYIRGDRLFSYHVNFPPEAFACLRGFLGATGAFKNPGYQTSISMNGSAIYMSEKSAKTRVLYVPEVSCVLFEEERAGYSEEDPRPVTVDVVAIVAAIFFFSSLLCRFEGEGGSPGGRSSSAGVVFVT